jgi:hypothetical protein
MIRHYQTKAAATTAMKNAATVQDAMAMRSPPFPGTAGKMLEMVVPLAAVAELEPLAVPDADALVFPCAVNVFTDAISQYALL